MKRSYLTALGLVMCSGTAIADREPGWDFGGELLYQFSQDVGFEGGSRANIDDDIGIALTFGYRFTPRLELIFGFDWNDVDYDINVAPGDARAGVGFGANGSFESWTPRMGLNFNFLESNLTPYVTGGIGWAFIDTNIPNAPAQTACWWDPWFGYYCGTFQSTRSIDEFVYNLGAGVRWDVSKTLSLRLGYEAHWIDLSSANGTPGFDQVKLGVAARY
jgi:opacity protein-like surface antigen